MVELPLCNRGFGSRWSRYTCPLNWFSRSIISITRPLKIHERLELVWNPRIACKAASWRNQGLLKTLESPICTNCHPFPWDYGRSRPVMWRLSNKKSKSPLLESKEASFYEKNCMFLEIPEKCAFLRIRRTRIFVGVAGDGKERSEEFWASYPLIPHRTSPFGLTTRRHVLLIRFIDRYFEIQFTETIVGSEPEIGSE